MSEYPEGSDAWTAVEFGIVIGGFAFCVYALANWDALVAKIAEVL